MRKRWIAVAASAAALALAASAVALGGHTAGKPILIGISAARTGALAPYDLQPGEAFQMRIDELNKAGGVLGRQIKVEWIDTKSDKGLAATNAEELIGKGAIAILGTCDFDYSAPALFAAKDHKLPGLSLCASSPKVATPAIVGNYAGSMGEGSDTEGVTMAEWVRKAHPNWKRAYVFKDTSLEYSKATADYFVARWKELGGKIAGEDDFVGGPTTDVSAQVTRLRGVASKVDFVYVGSWNPGGSIVVRQIRDAGMNMPITSNNSDDGTLVPQVAGKVNNYYSLASVCFPSYCSGENNPAALHFYNAFKAKYCVALTNSYPARGYDLASALVAAIKKAGSTNGPAIANALWSLPRIDTMSGPVRFTTRCHRPQPPSHVIEAWTNGRAHVVERWFVKSIPNIGDGSPCAGKQVPVPR